MGWKSGDACELGTILIDWSNRTVEIEGMDGIGPPKQPQDIVAFLTMADQEGNMERMALVYWYGANQLALYGIKEFTEHVWDQNPDDDQLSDARVVLPAQPKIPHDEILVTPKGSPGIGSRK